MALSAGQLTAIAAEVRHPRLLVKVTISGNELRYASGGNITFNGQLYSKSGVHVDQVKTGKGGIQYARFHLPNENYGLSQLLFTGSGFASIPVQAWTYYGQGNPSVDDVVNFFKGEVYKVPILNAQKGVLECATAGGKTKMVPDFNISSPDVNHLPYSGQTFIIGNDSYTVEIN